MFIVISYLPSGSNYCMGCLMESWDSDITYAECETKEVAAEFIASEEAKQAKNRKPGEPLQREYFVLEGSCLTFDMMSAKEALDILLEGSTV